MSSSLIINNKVFINSNEKTSEEVIIITTNKLIHYLSLKYLFVIISFKQNDLIIEEYIYPNELVCENDNIYYRNNKIEELFLS